jgi:hypothetical protein
MGGHGSQGDITMRNANGKNTIHLDGGDSNLIMGDHGVPGDINLRNENGDQTIHLNGGGGNITLGGNGSQGDIALRNQEGIQTFHIDGGNGEITINGDSVKPADYVFDPSYNLMPLAEVRSFIETNRHLPGIPAGAEMKAGGLSLNAFTMQLLAKVEELTLHVIRQEEMIRELQGK